MAGGETAYLFYHAFAIYYDESGQVLGEQTLWYTLGSECVDDGTNSEWPEAYLSLS